MTGSSRLTSAVLRDAIRKRVEETSYRAAAKEVGMSWSGLKSFADGGSPQWSTREKLVRWYYARSGTSPAVPDDDLETAIALVLNYLSDESKPRTVRERQRRAVIERIKEGGE